MGIGVQERSEGVSKILELQSELALTRMRLIPKL